jgi:hypothetical protein
LDELLTVISDFKAVRIQLKKQVFEKIEEGKRLMGLDVILRLPSGERCDENNTPVLTMFQMVLYHIKGKLF